MYVDGSNYLSLSKVHPVGLNIDVTEWESFHLPTSRKYFKASLNGIEMVQAILKLRLISMKIKTRKQPIVAMHEVL